MPKDEELFQASNKLKQINKIPGLKALHDHVIVRDMQFGLRQLASGILLPNDDAKTEGIRPRWARVYAVGPDQTEVQVGQWVFIEHGRWSRGLEVEIDGETFIIRRADPACIIFVSDDEPTEDDTISTAVQAERKSREVYS